MSKAIVLILIISFITHSLCVSSLAQIASGGGFTLEKSVIAGGGGQQSAGGNFSLDGTIGQAAAGITSTGSPFALASGFWNYSPSAPVAATIEADIAARPNGDGAVLSDDVVQIRRFLNGTNTPDATTSEFQRADSAPYATRGDGAIFSNDVVQARRYLNGTDASQPAGGPSVPVGNRAEMVGEESGKQSGKQQKVAAPEGMSRALRVESASSSAGQQVTANIRVDAAGDESEYGFALKYNSNILTDPVISAGAAGAAVRSCSVKPAGVLNCSVGAFASSNPASSETGIGEITAGANQILLSVTFTTAQRAPAMTIPVTLSDVNASSDAAQLLAIGSTNGAVTISGATRAVSVSGRVITAQGKGIRNVSVTITYPSGQTQTIASGESGYYQFTDIPAGETYSFSVSAKRYNFAESVQVREILDNTANIDFVGEVSDTISKPGELLPQK
jgi:hypothetical protein